MENSVPLKLVKNCPICGNLNTEFVLSKNHDGRGERPIFIYKCRTCKIVFLGSWNEGFNSDLYDYYKSRIGKNKSELYDLITESRYEKLLASFKNIVHGNRVLDVGCGQGHFVDTAMRNGWDVFGIELSKPAVTICKQFGLPVEMLDFFSRDLLPKSYDVITMFEFIEHVAHPHKFFCRAEELLKASGLLYLTTPNFASLSRRLQGINWDIIHREHLTYFTPQTLKSLINRYTSFNIVYIRTQNLSLATIQHLFSRIGKGEIRKNIHALDHEQELRQQIESSGILRLFKGFINHFLNWFDLGDCIVVLCRKKHR